MIKENFGYATALELGEKISNARTERDPYSSISSDEISFHLLVEDAFHAKKTLLEKTGLGDRFDDKGRMAIDLENFEDETHRENLFNNFKQNLGFSDRIYLSNIRKEDFLSGKISEDTLFEKDDFVATVGSRVGRTIRKVLVLKYLRDGKTQEEAEKCAEPVSQSYSRIFNEKASGKLVVSVNPFDFVSMSWGKNWSSCLDVSGEYETGSAAWALDEFSFVCYLTSNDNYDIIKEEGIGHSKQWRKLLMMSTDYKSLLSNRGYPYDGSSLTSEAALSLFPFERYYDSSEFLHKGKKTSIYHMGQNYNDICNENKPVLFTNIDLSKDDAEDIEFKLGKPTTCLSCGNGNRALPEGFMAECCSPFSCCEGCDEYCSEDDLYYVDEEGASFCNSCLDNSFRWSDEEGTYIHEDSAVWVDSINGYVGEDHPDLSNCKVCGESIYNNSDNKCEDCFEDEVEEEKTEMESKL